MIKNLILAALTIGSLNTVNAKMPPVEDSSTTCGHVAMDAVLRDIIKNRLEKPSDIDQYETLLGGTADITSTEKGESIYEAYFLMDDRYNVIYKVTIGQKCKILNLDVEGNY